MTVLGLHIENDHRYEFQCSYCNNNYHLKNCLKTHKREVHYKGTFVSFVRTHQELKQKQAQAKPEEDATPSTACC